MGFLMLYVMGVPAKTKLLDQVNNVLRVKHYSYRTEEAYMQWIEPSSSIHHKRHPHEMTAVEIN